MTRDQLISRTLKRKAVLWSEKGSKWEPVWRDISRYIMPTLGRFSDVTNKPPSLADIYDTTALRAARVLAAGLLSGMTSPARAWFKLGLSDKALEDDVSVKRWLADVEALLRRVFSASNTYQALHQCYLELALFGTAAIFVDRDYDDVIRLYPLTAGEYALGLGPTERVDTVYRPLKLSVKQLVERFGIDAVSPTTRAAYRNGAFDTLVDVLHVVEPRELVFAEDGKVVTSDKMPWASRWIELPDTLLAEHGFKRFPYLTPRWDIKSGDVYGMSPGMECLGDVKQLQYMQLKLAQAVEMQVSPPLQVPVSLRGQAVNRLPGGTTYVDSVAAKIAPLYEVRVDLSALGDLIADVRGRINAAFYVDIFRMFTVAPTQNMTATEVAERHEEKLLMLGPVLERLHDELLEPLIEVTFDRLAEVGVLPDPPEKIRGMDVEIEYISVLAQAQRAVSAAGTDRLIAIAGGLAGLKPDVLDKLDFDQLIDEYADMFGVSPRVIVSDGAVKKARELRAQLQAQQMQQQQMLQAVEAAGKITDVASKLPADKMITQLTGLGAVNA